MSVRRVMGIETEYGISVPGHPHVNSMMTSSQVVTAYGAAVTTPARLRARPRRFAPRPASLVGTAAAETCFPGRTKAIGPPWNALVQFVLVMGLAFLFTLVSIQILCKSFVRPN